MNAPELRTARLRLRPLEPSDLDALHRHWTDPDVRRFLWDGEIVPLSRVEEVIRTSGRMFEQVGAGLWTLRLLETVELLGCGGFWHFHEPPQLELVLSVSPASWGQGYGQEATGALLTHAFDGLNWPSVQASADAPNEPSLRLMRKLGMRRRGQLPGAFGEIEVYRISGPEWRARQR